jgi:O-antigen/teichoic acid export membrane protein
VNRIRKISTDLLVNAGVTAAVRLRGLIFIPVISGTLGVAAFGAYAQTLAIVTGLEVIVGLGLFSVLVRYGQEERQDVADLYYSLAVLATGSSVVAACLMTLFAPELSKLTLGDARYADVYRVGSILITTRVFFRIAKDYFRVDSRIKTYSLIQGIRAYGIVIGVVVALFVFDSDLTGVVYSMVLVESATAVGMQFKIGREIGYTVPSFDRTIEYLRYSLPYAGSLLTSNLSSRIDRILVGAFLGASAVGVYSIAYQIATAILMYRRPIVSTFFPEFSRFMEHDRHEECSRYLEQGIRYFVLIAVPTVGGMYLIGPAVIRVMVGSNAGTPSGLLLATIAFGIVIQGIDGIYGVVLQATKQTARLTSIRALGALANVLLNVALIPVLGVFGAAIATLGTYVLTALLVFYSVDRVLESEFATLTGVRTVVATVLMIVLAEVFLADSIVVLVLSGAIIYSVAIVLLGEISVAEIRRAIDAVV